MKTKLTVLGALLTLGVVASAQENPPTPKYEVGLNYTYTRVNPGGTLGSYNANGGSGYVEYNFNKVFGLVADLGGNRVGDANGFQVNNTSFEYLFGPRFNWRHSRYTPYVQALFGGERYSNAYNPNAANPSLGTSQNNFAAAFGGGLDIAISNHIAVKPIQIEYLTAQVPTGANNLNYAQNNFRYSAGVVFRFGSK
ncbi:MAG TPA: outer membrane beta-barrel protein [Bryobacteraceae bacterium]|nr:outer membrane beta-barrel protein [Bryobacteraceae bacterium]